MSDLIGWDNPSIAGVVPGCAYYKKARLDRMGLFADGFKELKKGSEPLYSKRLNPYGKPLRLWR